MEMQKARSQYQQADVEMENGRERILCLQGEHEAWPPAETLGKRVTQTNMD